MYFEKLTPWFNRLHHADIRRVENVVCPFDFESESCSFLILTFESPGMIYVSCGELVISRVSVCMCVATIQAGNTEYMRIIRSSDLSIASALD
jgi:hypothetical protein